MKLLFFSMWYFPEPVGKPHSLAKEMIRRGHHVTVITGMPNYPKGKIYSEYKFKYLIIENIDGVRVIRIKFFINRSQNAIKRIITIASYSFFSFVISIIIGNDYDAVWSYQIGFPALFYSVIYNKPHFHEVQDLWPIWAENSLSGMNNKLKKLLILFQRIVYMQSKKIFTISEGFAKSISSIFKIRIDKILVLSNWADSRVSNIKVDEEIQKSKNNVIEKKLIITYGGNIGKAQALNSLLLAANLLKDNQKVIFIIAGDGLEKQKLIKTAKELNLNNVVFYSSMIPEEMAKLLKVSDILYLGLSKDKKYRITIPSKIYTYYAIGKPILASVEGDTAELIKRDGVGFVVPAEDYIQIASKINEIINIDRNILENIGYKANILYNTKYSGNIIAKKYERAFNIEKQK